MSDEVPRKAPDAVYTDDYSLRKNAFISHRAMIIYQILCIQYSSAGSQLLTCMTLFSKFQEHSHLLGILSATTVEGACYFPASSHDVMAGLM